MTCDYAVTVDNTFHKKKKKKKKKMPIHYVETENVLVQVHTHSVMLSLVGTSFYDSVQLLVRQLFEAITREIEHGTYNWDE